MLKVAQSKLGWPSPDTLFNPPGSGAAVIADLARKKIEQRISKLDGGESARVGILTAEPNSKDTQAPVALVCEFSRAIPMDTLRQLHILAWNFSKTPLLITLEPNRIRAFSCCERPEQELSNQATLQAEITEAEYSTEKNQALADKAIESLHWLNLSCGAFQRQYPERFNRRYAADNTLLENLNVVRERLLEDNDLTEDLVHDLLARLIFIQFLFQRCDKGGTPALNARHLNKLHQEGVLKRQHESLGDILDHHGDTYALFKYLNDRFNGDLFPGKSDSVEQREKEWKREMRTIRKKHLELLRSFVTGEMKIKSGQMALWPLYSFDTIPLEFISSIYEAFVTKRKGTVYTPVHLVDFVLDGVLPWEGKEWDLKILDPACGSGIFLVRAYQRLAHRWKNANPGESIDTPVLRQLLERNLTGVDIDPHAVRVASFSLYLAMCDELDPRHYWQRIRFPILRNKSLITTDFFSEETPSIQTEEDAERYDLVVGNPPWAKNLIKTVYDEFGSNAAEKWAEKYGWLISNGDSGPLFVAKALRLTAGSGVVSLLQPTLTLLLNRLGPATIQRRKLFDEHQVTEVVNLSALHMKKLFKGAASPASIITLKPKPVEKDYSLNYIVVKPSTSSDNDYRFVIDSYDVHEIYRSDAIANPLILTALTWGSARDVALIRKLFKLPTIESYKNEGLLHTRWGIVRGDRKKVQNSIVGKKFLSSHDFPKENLLILNPENVPVNDDPETDGRASTSLVAFNPPQLILKQGWKQDSGRFRAMRVSPESESVLCSNSYVTVSTTKENSKLLDNICIALNSRLATYHLLLTSIRFSNYRAVANVEEQLAVPIPPMGKVSLEDINTYDDIDRTVNKAFDLKEPEQALVDDLFEITLPLFKGGENSFARKPTQRANEKFEDELALYLQWFIKVINATFGGDSGVCTTLFEESGNQQLPIRLVAIHLDCPTRSAVSIEKIGEGELSSKLTELYTHLSGETGNGPTCYRRVARIFETVEIDGKPTPTIFIAKPDEKRYWTRSMAMRDADEIASEIMLWQNEHQQGSA